MSVAATLLRNAAAAAARRRAVSAAHGWRGCSRRTVAALAAPPPGAASGVGFSAGGLLFPYYLGVVSVLSERGVLRDSTPLAGASAGALIAAAVAAKLPEDVIMSAMYDLCADLRLNGTRGRLRAAVQSTLQRLLPSGTAAAVSGRLHVAVTRISRGRLSSELISDFESDEDLIQALLTSSHIPLYSDGSPTVLFRGSAHCDGGVTDFLPLPPAAAETESAVRVCCFPAYSVAQALGRPGFRIDIAPDAPEPGSDVPVSPPYGPARMLQWALTPADDETLRTLLAHGRADAERFLEGRAGDAEASPQCESGTV